MTGNFSVGEFQDTVEQALKEIENDSVLERLWNKDHTLWRDDPEEIANRLGWLDSPTVMVDEIERMNGLLKALQDEGYTHALLLGMGGSSLAPEVFRMTYGVEKNHLDLAVLDSTDPGAVLATDRAIDLTKTLFIVATKSGGTAETLSFFKYFYNRVADEVGFDRAGAHFVAITDPGSKLIDLAKAYDFRDTFLNDPNIGGRYSALSFFGLLPATLVGVDTGKLLERAQKEVIGEGLSKDVTGLWLGAVMGELAKAGRNKITFVLADPVSHFGDWVEQLIAESTGKNGVGILPVVDEPLAEADKYGDDRLFVEIRIGNESQYTEQLESLEKDGHPVVRLELKDIYDLGGQFLIWEIATAIAGYRMGIQPFDQPNVESAKVVARQMVKTYTETGTLPEGKTSPVDGETMTRFLAQAKPGDYVCLQAFIQPKESVTERLQMLRTAIRDRYQVATVTGYGPRYLHSTGQLHKGDSGQGLFIQFVADDPEDAAIPDEAGKADSSMPFGVLKNAQALGDAQALLDEGRRLIRFNLGDDVPGALDTLIGNL